jgi:hypothetical protein
MGQPVILRSFAGGELSPSLWARADLAWYQQALRSCRNFVVRRGGGASNRTGFQYVATAKGTEVYLFPFVYAAADQSFVVEAGANYFRFYRRGAPVTVDGVPFDGLADYVPGDAVVSVGVTYYCIAPVSHVPPPDVRYWHALTGTPPILELPTPYGVSVFRPPSPLYWHQAERIVTLTHLTHPPRELVYESATRWSLRTLPVVPTIPPPTGLTFIHGVTKPGKTLRWVVTAVEAETYQESEASAILVGTGVDMAKNEPGYRHQLLWTAVPGAIEYNVYRDDAENTTFGYIGTATGQTTFFDIGQFADLALTPPVSRPLFDASLDFPAVNAVHDQRRIFAGTARQRDIVYASRIGQQSNFLYRSPGQDDDALTWRTVSKDLQAVVHLVSLTRLVMLTDRGEWVIHGDSDGVLLPTAINPKQHGYVGAGWTPPVVYGERVLFVQARDTILREMRFSTEAEGLTGRDLTVYADHLFRGQALTSMAFAHIPDAVVWVVRADGLLLGLTYIPDEDVLAWHRHDTRHGVFKQVCVIPEDLEDAVYVVVERTLPAGVVRYIERLATREPPPASGAPCYLDASKTYTGAPRVALDGLQHLAGVAVRVFADGVALPDPFVVSSTGTVLLPVGASDIHAGLPITAEIESLDLDVPRSGVRDRRKKVTALALLLEASYRGFYCGPDPQHLHRVTAAEWEVNDEPFTGRVELAPTTYFNDYGRVFLRHTEPTPLTLIGWMPHVDIGG